MEDIKKAWGGSYIETLIKITDNKVEFYRTPFYYGAHAPWVNDYDL